MKEAETVTSAGIHLRTDMQDAQGENRATVVAIDELEELVAVGDEIIIQRFAGEEFDLDGERYRFIPSHQVLARLSD